MIEEFLKSKITKANENEWDVDLFLGKFLLGGCCPSQADTCINEDVQRLTPIFEEFRKLVLKEAADLCHEMAVRYDSDIEGCDGEELTRYTEGIGCSERLRKIIEADEMHKWIGGHSVIPGSVQPA